MLFRTTLAAYDDKTMHSALAYPVGTPRTATLAAVGHDTEFMLLPYSRSL